MAENEGVFVQTDGDHGVVISVARPAYLDVNSLIVGEIDVPWSLVADLAAQLIRAEQKRQSNLADFAKALEKVSDDSGASQGSFVAVHSDPGHIASFFDTEPS